MLIIFGHLFLIAWPPAVIACLIYWRARRRWFRERERQ